MASENSPRPLYHSPSSLPQGRHRRASGRKSFTSTALPPTMESPRTLCPKDGDAFSYKASYLPRWYVPQELWVRLPQQLQSALTSMQHAGAAVLTGFERVEQLSGDIDIGLNTNATDDEMLVQLDDSIHSLPSLPPRLRTDSSACSSAVLSSPSSGTGSPTSSFSASQTTSPVSPFCLTPADAKFPAKRPRERSFSTPLEPHNAYYAKELSQLRTESLPRLRHAARKVDTEWYEVKRMGTAPNIDINEFENWWTDKKCTILTLNEKCKRLSTAIGLSPTGMGWTAP